MVMGKVQVVAGAHVAAQFTNIPKASHAEEVSLFMDGELDADRVEGVCLGMRDQDGMATWVCYHVIGDTLRGSNIAAPGFAARFSGALAAEPTVLAPPQRRAAPTAIAWAAAATVAAVSVVGWVALSTMAAPPTVLQTAQRASSVRPGDVRPPVDNEYLMVHQEYSPSVGIQGARPYLRSVVASEQDARP
jgi:sigma-E factor negative regulatory protein RseA